MKKFIILLLLIISVLSLFGQKETALTIKTKGEIKLVRNSDSKIISKGEILFNEDKVFSSANSFAAFKFIDGCGFIKVFENSVLILKSSKQKSLLKKTAFLEKGKIFSDIKKKFGDYQVETPGTIASIKGTKFLVETDESGKTDLYVFEGLVNLKNKKDGKEVNVRKGFKASSTGFGKIIVTEIEDNEYKDTSEQKSINLKFKNKNNEERTIEIQY